MLKIDGVTYRYKGSDKNVLSNLSVSFERGKLYSVVGPSGSGKTTLLSIMAGLDRPTSGDVFIEDESLSTYDLSQYRSKRVAMVFQAFHLFPFLTALENVSFPLEAQGVSKSEAQSKAKEYLENLEISDDKHNRYPANLSGGEQQRVSIARAIITGAKVILADEPTGNLDEETGKLIVETLKKLAHEQDCCVIIVTHNLDIAETSDVVYRMSYGKLK